MFNNPFTNSPYSPENLQRLQQMQQINQVNNYNLNQPPDTYTELQNKISKLSNDEKQALLQNEEFANANQLYEQCLLNFILNQYRTQFNGSSDGQKLLSNLDSIFEKSIKLTRENLDAEREQIKQVTELIKNNPEIIEMLNKSKTKKDGQIES